MIDIQHTPAPEIEWAPSAEALARWMDQPAAVRLHRERRGSVHADGHTVLCNAITGEIGGAR